MLQQLLLTDSDVEKIYETALRTLETVGMMFQGERLLKALEAKGAQIDWPKERAIMPRSLVQNVIDTEAASAPEPPTPSLPASGMTTVGGQVAQLIYDHELGRGREGTRDDFLRLIQFGDALHGDSGVGQVLLRRDIPQPVEPIEAQALLIEHTRKPSSAYFYYAEQLDYAAEIGEIHCGDRKRFTGGGVFLTSPLRLCRRACALIVKKIDMGFEGAASSMPVVGASVPVTMAGAVALSAAEIMGAWTAYRALREDVGVRSGIAAGGTDMRTGHVSFSSPDAMMLNFGVVEFFRRLCGKRIPIAGGRDYCDAKVPGLRAAWEKAHKAMTIAAFTGTHPGVGGGMVDSGKILSPEQILIEREVSQSVQHLFRPVETNDETLAAESILDVGVGIEKTHLETEHTLAHFRDALWSSSLDLVDPPQDDQTDFARDRAVVDQAHEHYEEIRATYDPPSVDEDKLRAVWDVVEKAKKELADKDLA